MIALAPSRFDSHSHVSPHSLAPSRFRSLFLSLSLSFPPIFSIHPLHPPLHVTQCTLYRSYSASYRATKSAADGTAPDATSRRTSSTGSGGSAGSAETSSRAAARAACQVCVRNKEENAEAGKT
eukprot:366196-Chlamydomonas_euryale.AAC.8